MEENNGVQFGAAVPEQASRSRARGKVLSVAVLLLLTAAAAVLVLSDPGTGEIAFMEADGVTVGGSICGYAGITVGRLVFSG